VVEIALVLRAAGVQEIEGTEPQDADTAEQGQLGCKVMSKGCEELL
jgi:hypothetical protein